MPRKVATGGPKSRTASPKSATELQGILEAIQEIRASLETRSRSGDLQQVAFDQLYEELQQYKEDFVFQAEKPLLLDLLLFHDSLLWFQENLGKKDISQEVIAETFQYLLDEFLEVLYRRDVAPVETPTSFDPAIQKAVKMLPTPDASKDKAIGQVLKRGFRRGDRMLRPEEVVVYRHDTEGGGTPER